MQRRGPQAAFVSAGGYHHHIGLNTWESRGGNPPPRGSTGLYHLAVLYPSRAALADALRRLMAANVALEGAFDHGVSEALYLRDPDDNGVRTLLGSPARAVAAQCERRACDVHRAARSDRAAQGARVGAASGGRRAVGQPVSPGAAA
jgi:catechol-2,3-dioxygenase